MIPTDRYPVIRLPAAVLTLTTAAGLAWAGLPALEVFPTHPSCFHETTFKVQGSFPDSCYAVEEITLNQNQNPPSFVFAVSVLDSWEPGNSCAPILVEYSAHETVDPLPGGRYTLTRDEIVDSVRYAGSDFMLPFEVACCTPLPSSVTDLRVGKTEDFWRITLIWSNTADAESYSIYQDLEPDGAFANLAGIVPNGESGVDVWLSSSFPPPNQEFFLVSGNNACGSGHPRDSSP